jgi:hypothetical protein
MAKNLKIGILNKIEGQLLKIQKCYHDTKRLSKNIMKDFPRNKKIIDKAYRIYIN